jgi:hypothetical protein
MNITLNNEQQLFVISTGNSVSCLGFDVVYQQARELCRRLKAAAARTKLAVGMDSLVDLVAPTEDEIGTLEQFQQHRLLMAGYTKLDDIATWYDARTPAGVQSALEAARRSNDVMRVFTGDTVTGRDWMEEYDTIGRIGRSGGAMKVPLLVPKGDNGGPALLTHCIVRIINVTKGKEVYKHPTYHAPKMELVEAASYDKAEGYTHCVKMQNKDGELETCANFKSNAEAGHWLAFMNGLAHDYPVSK